MIAHWDEVDSGRGETGHLGGVWSNLGTAARDQDGRAEADPRRSGEVVDALSPADSRRGDLLRPRWLGHLPAGRREPSRSARATASSTCGRRAHALRAGDEGLDVLAFGTRGSTEIGHLPRAGVAWIGGTWTRRRRRRPSLGTGGRGRRAGGAGARRAPGERRQRRGRRGRPRRRELEAAGAGRRIRADGAQLGPSCRPGEEGRVAAPPLGGRGDLRRARGRRARSSSGRRRSAPATARVYEEQPLRAGSVVSRPASSGIAHSFRAGDAGLVFLAYGTRNANDVCYYPRSNKIYFRGLGLVARLESLDYDDGEPDS